jgi:protein tyrosine phosphatase (PTP) superfamily phosphohydrolase (DUF442 family)
MRRTLSLLGLFAGLLALVIGLYALSPYLLRQDKQPPPVAPPAVSQVPVPPAVSQKTQPQARRWAEPLSRTGLTNLHKISGDLYRGAQPSEQGYKELKALGIKTVVNLRSLHGESGYVRPLDLDYLHIFFNPLGAPDDQEVLRFLKVVLDKNLTPVFVHCAHGADRTGVMCAAYRVVVQGWTKEEAVEEMKQGGFGFHGAVYESYARYVLRLDPEAMRKALELPLLEPQTGATDADF